MTILILHLSDIHIDKQYDPILKKSSDIARCTYASLPSASHVFIIVSGDIANAGIESQYDLASQFLTDISSAIRSETQSPISILVAPGNHDCDFSKDSGTRKAVIRSLDTSPLDAVDESIITTCTSIQKDFFTFRDRIEDAGAVSGDNLWHQSHFRVGGKAIRFETLNVSWVSKLKEISGTLHFPFERYSEHRDPAIHLNVVMMHHPFNWFSQGTYRPFRAFIRRRADLLFTGHEHEGNVGIIDDAEGGKGAFIEGCVLQHKGQLSESSFNVAIADLERDQFSSTRYTFASGSYRPAEEGSWFTYRDLPAKRTNSFKITESFQNVLDDPGAFLRHPASTSVTLSDIYIFPDLQKLDGGDGRRRTLVSASSLRSLNTDHRFSLIEGDEKSGRTSLLYQLFAHHYDQGYCPVFIQGKSLRRNDDEEIDKSIRQAIGDQYGASAVSSFEQLATSKKVLLLDNFNETPLKDKAARANLLDRLRSRFGSGVITVDDIFDISEVLDADSARAVTNVDRYSVQQFGYARRTELLQKWFSLGADGTMDESTYIARCEHAERIVEVAMTKTVIPSVPLYLLTLLQSIEAGRSGDFKDSALGYYYQYLLTESFRESGVKDEKLTEFFIYTSHLAWHFHTLGKHELSEFELRDFNFSFSQHWHTVELQKRIETLLNARVLQRIGSDYSFRYPYIYYYLKAQYLSHNLSLTTNRDYVSHCCHHLYVRDNANTVLFLAHHTTDEFVVDSIVESLRRLFEQYGPVAFNGDTVIINELIQDAPKLAYSGESPQEHRRRTNALRDELDDGEDGLADQHEPGDILSPMAQLTTLFKTIEILGQILKTQYAKIPRTRKRELIAQLFGGPLRALQYFYQFISNNPESLIADLEAALKTKGDIEDIEKRKAFARKVIASLLQSMSFLFILKAGQSVNSDSLQEDINDVVRKSNSMAFRLIELYVHLDSPKSLPRRMLVDLHKETENHIMAGRLLRMLVLNRLYMFKTSERDMQWLSSELNFDLESQHAISYREIRQRRLR